MDTRCTITIPVSEEESLQEAINTLSRGKDDITYKKVGRAEIVSSLMGVEQAHYDIYLKNISEDPERSTTLFQLGQCAAYAQIKAETEQRLKGQ